MNINAAPLDHAGFQAMKKVGKLPKEEQAAARTPLVEKGRELREQEKQLDDKMDAPDPDALDEDLADAKAKLKSAEAKGSRLVLRYSRR